MLGPKQLILVILGILNRKNGASLLQPDDKWREIVLFNFVDALFYYYALRLFNMCYICKNELKFCTWKLNK